MVKRLQALNGIVEIKSRTSASLITSLVRRLSIVMLRSQIRSTYAITVVRSCDPSRPLISGQHSSCISAITLSAKGSKSEHSHNCSVEDSQHCPGLERSLPLLRISTPRSIASDGYLALDYAIPMIEHAWLNCTLTMPTVTTAARSCVLK